MTEVDVSIDNGPGVNEREFVNTILDRHDDVVKVVLPYPSDPRKHFDERVDYIRARAGWGVRGYFDHQQRFAEHIERAIERGTASALAVRLGTLPFAPYRVTKTRHVPLFLKTLAGYMHHMEQASAAVKLANPFRLAMIRKLASRTTHADTVCETYVSWCEEMYGIDPSRMAILPNGANTTLFDILDRESCKREIGVEGFSCVLGYVGALNELRHVGDVILPTSNSGTRPASFSWETVRSAASWRESSLLWVSRAAFGSRAGCPTRGYPVS
jgi:hypothetical protein